MELLTRYYGRVQTLKDWLCTSFDGDDITSRGLMSGDTDDESYKKLLTCVYVCEDTDKNSVPGFTLSHYHEQRELVLTAIERILSKKGYGKNVLTYGFCLMSPDPFALSCGVNVESRYPNSCVNRLFYPAWETLLSRTGDTVMMFLLEHTSLFYQVSQSCLVQISGAPINNLSETFAPQTNGRTPSTHQFKNSYKDGKSAKTQLKVDTLHHDACDDTKESNSNKLYDCSSVCVRKFVEKRIEDSYKEKGKKVFKDIKNDGCIELASDTNKTCNTCKRKSKNSRRNANGKKKRKYEDVSENRFLELKRRSALYASRGKILDLQTEGEQDIQPLFDVTKEDAGNWKGAQSRKRKFDDTDLESSDKVDAGADLENSGEVGDSGEGETKRRRFQTPMDCGIGYTASVHCGMNDKKKSDLDGMGKQEWKGVERMRKSQIPAGNTFSKTVNKKKMKKKCSKISKEKEGCRPFHPFEYHLPLPRNSMLFSRNPRERFTKSVLMPRLDTTPENVLLLYKEIFCETKVLSDSETVRVTAPGLHDIQIALGIPEDKPTTGQYQEGDSVQNLDSTYRNVHPSFWNDSNGKKSFLFDLSSTSVPSETLHPGFNNLCRDLSDSDHKTYPESSVFPSVVANHKDSDNAVEIRKHIPSEKSISEELKVTQLQVDNSMSAESVCTADSGNGITATYGKEALLAKRRQEIILKRENAELDKAKSDSISATFGNVQIISQQGEEKVVQNIRNRNSNRNNTGSVYSLAETHRTQMSPRASGREGSVRIDFPVDTSRYSVEDRCVRQNIGSQHSAQNVCTSPHSAQDTSTSQHSAQNVCTTEHAAQNVCTSPHSAQDTSTSQQSAQNVCITEHSAQNVCITEHSAQNVCTSPHSAQNVCPNWHSAQILCSSQPSAQETSTSQHSVQCASRQAVDIPVFTDIIPLLQQLIEKHRRCPFKQLLNHHCPAVGKKTASRVYNKNRRGRQRRSRCLSVSQLLCKHHHHRKVYLFLRACIVRLLPVELLGTKQNWNILMKNISKMISLGKFDRLTVGQMMHGVKTSEVDWLSSTHSNSVKLHLVAKVMFWFFSHVLATLKTFFYITDTGFLRYKLLYYRQTTWNKLHSLGINGLVSRKILKIISEKKALEMLQSRTTLGVSLLRFLPKQQSLRPIINMGSAVTLNSYQTQSVNMQLSDLHSILTYLKNRNPSLIGYGKLGTDDIYEAWKSFVQQWRKMGSPKLYFVKTDISNCYDSIRQNKLYSIMEDILSTEMSDEEYVIRKYFTISMKNGCVQRKYHRDVTPMSEFNPDFLSYSKQVAERNRLKNTIFVDKVVYQHETCETLLRLLKQHLYKNLVKVGNHYCVQTDGISQGSVISTLLCSFYYADMEKGNLFKLVEGEFLMRIVDDYLYVTPSQPQAVSFVKTMIQEWFPWCGVLFNTSTLEVSMDFSKYSGFNIRDTMTMELSKTPGKSLKKKIVFSVRQKCHALYVDMTINSEKQMFSNLYQQFLLAVFKLHAYIQRLHHKQRAESNFKYFLGVIREMIHVVDCLVKRHLVVDRINEKDTSTMVYWLCLKACCVKLSCHHAQYKPLLNELKKQLNHKQEYLTCEEKAVLNVAVEPSIPEAFQYFLT